MSECRGGWHVGGRGTRVGKQAPRDKDCFLWHRQRCQRCRKEMKIWNPRIFFYFMTILLMVFLAPVSFSTPAVSKGAARLLIMTNAKILPTCVCVCVPAWVLVCVLVLVIALSQRLPACVPPGDSLIFYFVCVFFTRISVKSQNKHKNPLQIRAARHLNQILIVAISCFAFEIKTFRRTERLTDWLTDWLRKRKDSDFIKLWKS